MQKMKDYLKVVKNGIANSDKIIEAMWVSAQIKNEGSSISEEAIAEIMKRKEICSTCPYNSKNAAAHGMKALDVSFQHCILCTCRIGGDDSKEYCLSCQCGISELNRQNPDKPPVPLKWSAFTDKNNNNG